MPTAMVGFLGENSGPLEPHGSYHAAYPSENLFSLNKKVENQSSGA